MVYGLFFFLTGFVNCIIFSSDKLIDTFGNCPPQQFPGMNHKMPMIRSLSVYRYELPLSFVKEPEAPIRVERHPEQAGWLRLYLPYELVSTWLSTVRNIPGRRWDPVGKVWEIPYTRSTLRFLERHLREVASLAFTPDEDISEQQEAIADRRVATLYRSQSSELRLRAPAADQSIRERISRIYGQRWDEAAGCWWVPNRESTLAFIRKIFGEELVEVWEGKNRRLRLEAEHCPDDPALQQMEERLILVRYSIHTRKSYLGHFRAFLHFFRGRDPETITREEIEQYLLTLIRRRKISESTQNGVINAIKFYYEQVLGRPKERYDITRPKKQRQLPNVLSEEEVTRLVGCVKNLKHRCILLLIYSAGLRLSELINLRVRDINVERRSIFVKAGKGKKDRYTVLADSVLPVLAAYRKNYRPAYWLFEGQDGGQYSKRSVQNIFNRAREASGINPFATVHTLRHSFATHCIEAGYSVAVVQQVLGHESIKTTERYLHVSTEVLRRLRSPLDNLGLDG